jgi:hypothetical protein
MKLQLADFAPYLGLATTDKKLQDFLFQLDAINTLKIKCKENSFTHYVNKKMQYELYFEEKEAIDTNTNKEMVCFSSVAIPLDKTYKGGLIILPDGINASIQRSDVIAIMGSSSANYERNGNILNDRWFYDNYKRIINYYPNGNIKSISLSMPEDSKNI